MLENGVLVYFVDEETFKKIKEADDGGFETIGNLVSENERHKIEHKDMESI